MNHRSYDSYVRMVGKVPGQLVRFNFLKTEVFIKYYM